MRHGVIAEARTIIDQSIQPALDQNRSIANPLTSQIGIRAIFAQLCLFSIAAFVSLVSRGYDNVHNSQIVSRRQLPRFIPPPLIFSEMHSTYFLVRPFRGVHDRNHTYSERDIVRGLWVATRRDPKAEMSLCFGFPVHLRGVIFENAMPLGPALARKRSGSITVGSVVSHVYS